MKFGLALVLGILIFSAGIHGDLGSILACLIDPGALSEVTSSGITSGTTSGFGLSPVPTGTLGTSGIRKKPGCTYSCPVGYTLVTHQDGTIDCTDPLRGHGTVAPIVTGC